MNSHASWYIYVFNLSSLLHSRMWLSKKIRLGDFSDKWHQWHCLYMHIYIYLFIYICIICPGNWLSVYKSVQVSSVTQSCLTLCDPKDCSAPGLPVHHQLPEFTQTHIQRVSDAIQPILSSVVPFSSCPQSLPVSEFFEQVNSSHEVAKVLKFQL